MSSNSVINKVFSDNYSSIIKSTQTSLPEEFKLMPAVVLDVITNDEHPYFKRDSKSYKYQPTKTIDQQTSPVNYIDLPPNSGDIDYSYIGRIRFRLISPSNLNNINSAEEDLTWAIPLDNTITQYPLLNEQILVIKIDKQFYYTKPLCKFNYCSVNADFSTERTFSKLSAFPTPLDIKRQSYLYNPNGNTGGIGYLGSYFIFNPYIRSVKKYEGDTVIESRFGQSIRFTAYNDNRTLDNGSSKYSSYNLNKNIFKSSSAGGYGNPRIIIRNRQRNLARATTQNGVHGKEAFKISPIKDSEKNYGGTIEEDINNDGSTIEINSGIVESKWKTSVYKSIFASENEEQTAFSPAGCSPFKIPTLDGDQIVINTDRLILSSRLAETLHFSKKRYAVVTDSEYTVDANDQIVMTTNALTCFNSPLIYLGQYGENNEPALLGQTTVDWLYDLCNWLLDHAHWHYHVHPHPHSHEDAGLWDKLFTEGPDPEQTQIPVQQMRLQLLRDKLHRSLSRRVFITGGGYAEGRDGKKPTGSGGDCSKPVEINMVNGSGGITAFKGRNRREGPVQTVYKYDNAPEDMVGLQEKVNKLETLPTVTSLSQGEQLKDIYKQPINDWVNSVTDKEAKILLADRGISRLMESKGTLEPLTKRV